MSATPAADFAGAVVGQISRVCFCGGLTGAGAEQCSAVLGINNGGIFTGTINEQGQCDLRGLVSQEA